ncbi:hypothetical protein IWZ01DRAFT_483584 [Phyllosticta capitalensis]
MEVTVRVRQGGERKEKLAAEREDKEEGGDGRNRSGDFGVISWSDPRRSRRRAWPASLKRCACPFDQLPNTTTTRAVLQIPTLRGYLHVLICSFEKSVATTRDTARSRVEPPSPTLSLVRSKPDIIPPSNIVMAPTETQDSKALGAFAQDRRRFGGQIASRNLSDPTSEDFPNNRSNVSSSTQKSVLSHSPDAEPAKNNTRHSMTTMSICPKCDIINTRTHSTNLRAVASPSHCSENARVNKDIQKNNDLRRRIAMEDLLRRIAIDSAIQNLGMSYVEAVELITRLKELQMDLGVFVRNIRDAKERSEKKHALGEGAVRDGGENEEDFPDGEGEEHEEDNPDVEEEEHGEEQQEWRLWCE